MEARVCALCGRPLAQAEAETLCPICLQREAQPPHSPSEPLPWGLAAALALWIFFIFAITLLPALGVFFWATARGYSPADLDRLHGPEGTLVQVSMLFFAHLLTLLIGWVVVTQGRRRPFLRTLGWGWHPRFRFRHVVLTVGGLYGFIFALSLLLPSRETAFDRLLQISPHVRVVIALLAVGTAPLVEELVYRGVLYPALQVRLGRPRAIAFVTILFAVVHYPQYSASTLILVAVTVLSFVITLIRAYTGQLLPCVVTHLIYNAIGAFLILSGYAFNE
ncbi:MAG: CPBP family intramembrane metalloprotease [Blastocatellia bacterium]|nr:CPBP family intramembrane metalloprotease [Blastocatellia bacterium]